MSKNTMQVTTSNKKTVSLLDNQGGNDTAAKRLLNEAA